MRPLTHPSVHYGTGSKGAKFNTTNFTYSISNALNSETTYNLNLNDDFYDVSDITKDAFYNNPNLLEAVNISLDFIDLYSTINFTISQTYTYADIKIHGVDDPNASFDEITSGWQVFRDDVNNIQNDLESHVFFRTQNPPPLLFSGDYQGDKDVGALAFLNYVTTHELLHSVGLFHVHTRQGPTTSFNDEPIDNIKYSQTSYRKGDFGDITAAEKGEQKNGYASTPMALDIAALHSMYGASTYNTSNSNYTLTDPQTTAIDLYGNQVSIGEAFFCIWDSGGTDVIDYSGNKNAVINLNSATIDNSQPDQSINLQIIELLYHDTFLNIPQGISVEYLGEGTGGYNNYDYYAGGFFSRLYDNQGNVVQGGYSIAKGAEIENATSGDGNDLLVGNVFDNTLTANSGHDTLHGGSGNDLLYGGQEDDILLGGQNDDALYGGLDNDFLDGGSGHDGLYGGDGDDIFQGSLGSDLINGGDGSDIVKGNQTNYISESTIYDLPKIYKEQSNIQRQDLNTSLRVNAGAGNDAIYGTWHQDTLNGDGGNDLIFGTHYEHKSGTASTPILERPDGDYITGGTGNDIIIAGYGNDTINGGQDSDFIYASLGDDEITGGTGSDHFYFRKEESSSSEQDIIKDFTFDTDVIELEYELIFSLNQMTRYQSSNGTGESEQEERADLISELQTSGIIDEVSGNFVFSFLNGSQLILENSLLTGAPEQQVESFFNSVIINDEGAGSQSDGVIESLTDALSTVSEAEKQIQGENVLDYITDYMQDNTGLVQEGGYSTNGINQGTQFADLLLLNEDGIWLESGQGDDYIEATYTAEILSATAQIDGGDGNDYIKAGFASEVLYGGSGNDLIHDGDGNDTVYGGSENDVFYDGEGNDSLYGQAGDDIFYVGAGSNIYDGYHGTDTASLTLYETSVTMDFLQNSFTGEMADDTFVSIDIYEATHFDDLIVADNNGLHLKGAGGNDQVFGGTGADELHGDHGDDYIEGKGGADVLYGGIGNDTLDAKLNGDNTGATLYGGEGDDILQGSTGSDMLYGGAGNDDIDGSTGSDEIYGGDDNDDIDAQGSNDLIYAGNGDDDINMGSGNDTAYGGAGNDVFTGYSGNNEFYGGTGTDTFNGGTDTDIVNFSLDEAAVLVDITQGSLDTDGTTVLEAFTSIEAVVGSTFDDDITGDVSNNTLSGHDGNDILTGQSGNDVLNGDAGNDTLEGGNDDDLLYGGDGDDTLYGGAGTDDLYGGSGNDELFGESGNDNMYGGSGNDILHGNVWVDYLFGGNDNDTLKGGSSNDELTGGLGADSFVFNQGDGHDTIFDFSAAQSDVLTLDQGAFTSGTTLSDISSSAYINGSGHLRIDIDTGGSITLEGVTSISVNELEWI